MAATEYDIIRDEQERSNLLRAIAGVETVMAGSTPATRATLENTVENAKKRVAVLDKRIEEAKVAYATEVQTQAAALAAKETKLNAEERETYRNFLEKSYFTRKDFGKLDEFYRHGYDRLSDGGKEEMSKRIHEGIKRGEFEFTDLPQSVQKYEAVRDRQRQRMRTKESADFTPATNKHAVYQPEEDNSKASLLPNSTESSTKVGIDLSSVQLTKVRLVDTDSPPLVASIPSASISNPVGRG